jgi:phosphatidate cytidylyltransferase
MLRSRLLTALIFIPTTIAFLLLGGWPLAFALGVVLLICAWEYHQALHAGGFLPQTGLLFGGIGLAVVGTYFNLFPSGLGIALALLMLAASLAMVAAFESGDGQAFLNTALTVFGVLYIGWLGAHIYALRALPEGAGFIFAAVMATGLGDAGAYLTGRTFGKRQFSPHASPSKTWEGYFGGGLTATLVGALAGALFPALGVAHGAVLGYLVGFVSPIGDLLMSVLKRMANIKNFSGILPGHGGMLDRLDSILIAVALAYYMLLLLRWA